MQVFNLLTNAVVNATGPAISVGSFSQKFSISNVTTGTVAGTIEIWATTGGGIDVLIDTKTYSTATNDAIFFEGVYSSIYAKLVNRTNGTFNSQLTVE
jgi:hypothetical protein